MICITNYTLLLWIVKNNGSGLLPQLQKQGRNPPLESRIYSGLK